MRRLWRASIWHPDAIPPDEFKYRNLKRVWLPLYDAIAIFAGIQAIMFGSTILNRLFNPLMVDLFGGVLTGVAVVCLAGVAFPRLWAVEIVGKILLVGLVAGYVTTILLFSENPGPNLFVVGMLTFGLPLAFFRLNLLGEEFKERRAVVA
ncbi:hypothetical protein [Microbacterium plantarum]|uniref:hypothetical protein n=1 Tax=Microbacterium plantarum TaxID=1816425 RepID=UPI002B48EE0B|nr:hypothetical protein [Microbacterium plantarum]WRK16490.1 hypothetical protein VC184_11285 [Microbacterium plantarum]